MKSPFLPSCVVMLAACSLALAQGPRPFGSDPVPPWDLPANPAPSAKPASGPVGKRLPSILPTSSAGPSADQAGVVGAPGAGGDKDKTKAPAVDHPILAIPPFDDIGPCLACTNCQPFCGPPGRVWVRGEYLLWWLEGQRLPALLTASPLGTSQDQAGVLGTPGTTVLFGDSRVNEDARSGGRITLGAWFDARQTVGLEGNFFGVGGDRDGI